jgi:hypothetical protein
VKRITLVIGLIWLTLALTGCKEELGVQKISPAIGVLSGGEPVEIIGSGFHPGMGITVYMGMAKADNVAIRSSKKLTITTPGAKKPGTVDVRVETDDGHTFLIKHAFTYIEKSAGNGMDIRQLGQRKSLRKK